MTPQSPVQDEASALETLRGYPFLRPLQDGLLKRLRPNLIERRYRPGDIILRAGEYSDAAFYLKEGFVELRFAAAGGASVPSVRTQLSGKPARGSPETVVRPSSPSGRGPGDPVVLSDMPIDLRPNQQGLLEPGDLFGEINALARYALSTTVVAHTDVVCLAIRTPALRMLFKQSAIAWFKDEVDAKYRQRVLGQHLRQVALFSELTDVMIDRLRGSAELLSFEPGERIVEQNTTADAFFLVRGGNVKVTIRTGTRDLAVTYLRKGDYTGEIALLMDEPWPFGLEALEYVELVKIPREAFQAVVAQQPAVGKRLWEEVVRRLKERGAVARNPLTSQHLQMAMDSGLIHGESVLLIDLNTCTRCDDCVRACADNHGGTPRFIREDRFIQSGTRYKHWMVPLACYQCSDPACMVGCPTGAISRPLGTLEVTIDPTSCIGCGNCSRRCPWDNIVSVPHPTPQRADVVGELATKCDLCVGRAAGPACVQICPHGSAVRISFKDLDQVVRTLED